MLDVGCGYGAFLDLAREQGWRTGGVELDQAAAEAARESGHLVRCGSASDGDHPFEELFELVTLWDLLEHLDEPGAALDQAHTALARGGSLVIVTPFRESVYDRLGLIAHRLGRGRFDQLVRMCWSDVHLYRFDPVGLARQLKRRGFEVSVRQRRLMLSLMPDRYAGGSILPSWTDRPVVDRFLSRAGVAAAKALRLHNKLVVVARKR